MLSRPIICAAALLAAGCSTLGFNPRKPLPPPPDTQFSPPPVQNSAPPEMPAALPEVMGPMASVEPPPPPRPPAPPVRRPPPPKPPEPPPPPPRPPIVMNRLIGSDFDAILNVFRSPDVVQNSNLSVVWIYSPPGCTLQLFFYPDIQTTKFHLLKFDFHNAAGEALMSSDPCMQSMLTMRASGAPP